MRSCFWSVLSFALVIFVQSTHAAVTIDLTAIPGDGYSVSDDGKTVTPLQTNAVVTLLLSATISGNDSDPSNDALTAIKGAIHQTYPDMNAAGSLLLMPSDYSPFGYLPPFNLIRTSVTVTDDLLGTFDASHTGTLYYRSPVAQMNMSQVQYWQLGNVYYAINNPLGTASINYEKPIAHLTAFQFKLDGVSKIGTTFSGYNLVSVGSPVNIVPEPSTVFLLVMAGITLLLAYWGRKRI